MIDFYWLRFEPEYKDPRRRCGIVTPTKVPTSIIVNEKTCAHMFRHRSISRVCLRMSLSRVTDAIEPQQGEESSAGFILSNVDGGEWEKPAADRKTG